MKFSKLFTAFFSLSLVAIMSFGQSSPKADKILKESQSKFKSYKDISASFSYTLNNPNLDEPIVKSGSLKMSGKKYVIKFAQEEFFCNGKKVWVYLIEEEEVTITDYDPEEGLSLETIYKVYEDETKSRYDGESGGQHKVTLFMLDKKSDFWKAEIWITSKTKLISKAVMHSRNGTTYEYLLQNMKTNTGFSDGIFIFDINSYENPGDIYINDLTGD